MKNLIVLSLSAVLVISCSKKKNNSPPPVDKDLVTYDLKLEIKNDATLSSDEKQLVDKINAGEKVSFKQITDLYIFRQGSFYANKHEAELRNDTQIKKPTNVTLAAEYKSDLAQEHLSFVNELSQTLFDANYFSLKTAYESKIEEKNGESIIYNRDYRLTPDVQYENKMQCESGTLLNLMVARKTRAGLDYRDQNYVVIYTPGHVQPGIITEIGGKKNLVAIETTGAGDAILLQGAVDSLSQCSRILDADHYYLFKLFESRLSNKKEVAEKIQAIASEKHGIDNDKLVSQCPSQTKSSNSGVAVAGQSSGAQAEEEGDPFMVGPSTQKPGDIRRQVVGMSVAGMNDYVQMMNDVNQTEINTGAYEIIEFEINPGEEKIVDTKMAVLLSMYSYPYVHVFSPDSRVNVVNIKFDGKNCFKILPNLDFKSLPEAGRYTVGLLYNVRSFENNVGLLKREHKPLNKTLKIKFAVKSNAKLFDYFHSQSSSQERESPWFVENVIEGSMAEEYMNWAINSTALIYYEYGDRTCENITIKGFKEREPR